jgi:hypothetical protein
MERLLDAFVGNLLHQILCRFPMTLRSLLFEFVIEELLP